MVLTQTKPSASLPDRGSTFPFSILRQLKNRETSYKRYSDNTLIFARKVFEHYRQGKPYAATVMRCLEMSSTLFA